MEDKALQVGAAVLTLALLLRLGGTWSRGQEELGRTLLFLSSGRLVTETLPPETESATEPVEEMPKLLCRSMPHGRWTSFLCWKSRCSGT